MPDWQTAEVQLGSPVRRLWTRCRKRSLSWLSFVSSGSFPHTASQIRSWTLTLVLKGFRNQPHPDTCPLTESAESIDIFKAHRRGRMSIRFQFLFNVFLTYFQCNKLLWKNLTELSNVPTSSMVAVSYLGELCTLLELVLHTLLVLLGQMVLDVWWMAGTQNERWVAVRWRLRARSLQGSVRGYYSFPFGLVRLLLLQRNTTQAINCFLWKREKENDEEGCSQRTI